VFFQNPKERAVLLDYCKGSSASDTSLTVDSRNARNQPLSASMSPKKLPGSALLPSLPAHFASEPPETGKFGSDHYLASDLVSICVYLDLMTPFDLVLLTISHARL